MKELRYLNSYFIKYKYHFLLGIITTIGSKIFLLYATDLTGNAFTAIGNYLETKKSDPNVITTYLMGAVLKIIIVSIIAAILTFAMRQALIVMSRHVEYDLKNVVFKHYEYLTQNFYKQNRTGDLMNRISEDVGRVRQYVGPAIMYAINTGISFFMVILYMTDVSTKLTLYALLPLPILAIIIFKLSKEINKRSTVFQENLSVLSSYTQEIFSGIRVIKAYSIEDKKQVEFESLSEESNQKSLKLAKVNALFGPLMIFLIGFSNLIVIFTGSMMYMHGEIKYIGDIAKFILFINMLTWPVASIGWVSSLVQDAESSQRRINEFLKIVPEIQNKNIEPMTFEGNIEFHNVSVVYEDTNIKALDHISFSIKKGETTAIIGRTGSGKSTILSLICRLYDPTEGYITIDGVKLPDANLDDLRRAIGFVPQDAFLFSDTIKNNIKFGKENATDLEVIAAAENAAVAENINGFKDQYETILGERGITLSGGQKQRVSIARAIISNPEILLLDDCLSAVDTETEEAILNNLEEICKGKTTIIVSHRVSSAKNADKIIILDHGKIVQEGTHNQLLSQDGYYAALYLKQIAEKEML